MTIGNFKYPIVINLFDIQSFCDADACRGFRGNTSSMTLKSVRHINVHLIYAINQFIISLIVAKLGSRHTLYVIIARSWQIPRPS